MHTDNAAAAAAEREEELRRRKDMRARLISKRTSFGFSQSHLSALTAVTGCHTVTVPSVTLSFNYSSQACRRTGFKLATEPPRLRG